LIISLSVCLSDPSLQCGCYQQCGTRVQQWTPQVLILQDSGYTDTSANMSPSPGFHLRVVCHSYKLHPYEWSVHGH